MAEKKAKPQHARIEQPFGYPPPVVHCPICGQATVDTEEGVAIPCPHLAFIYAGSFSEYVFTSADYDERTKALNDEEFSLNNSSEFLSNAGYGNNLLALEVTYGGMACGPVWHTDVYGFDFAFLANNGGS